MLETFDDADFGTLDEAGWRALAEKALVGQPFESLVSETEDGVAYGPIHSRREPVRPIARGGRSAAWSVVQRVDDPDPVRANAQALADLEGGADTLSLVFEGAPSARGFGLPPTDAAIRTALDGVLLDIVHLRIEPHRDAQELVMALRRLAVHRRIPFDRWSIDTGLGGIDAAAFSGSFRQHGASLRLRQAFEDGQRLILDGCAEQVFEADGRVYHEAGASEAQELAAVLSSAVAILRAYGDEGIDLELACGRIGFTLAADQKQFVVTAKIRALRLLWARLLDLCDLDAAYRPARIHVETSFRMMAAKDPHTNILRTTVAAFAAATGGADSISVLPFTAANGLPEAKARRLARNTQAILQEESGLGRVDDPAAGSGGIEALTEGLAAAAWTEFRRIEAEGGILASLSSGRLQGRIQAVREARARSVATGGEAVVGVTLHPPAQAVAVAVSMALPAAAGKGGSEAVHDFAPLAPYRISEAAEALA